MRKLCGLAICIIGLFGLPYAAGPGPNPHASAGSLGGLVRASQDLGRVDRERPISLLLSLKDPTREARALEINAIYDRSSSSYGRFLSPSDFTSRFGPVSASVEPVLADLRGFGLSGTWHAGNPWLRVEGTAARFEHAFGVEIRDYRSRSGIDFYAATAEPTIPPAWRSIVTDIGSLTDYHRPQTFSVRAGGMTPDDVIAGYDMRPLRDLGIDGTGETVVVTVPDDGYRQANLDAFTSKFGLPPIAVDLSVGIDDPLKIALVGELEMDLEVIHAIAPGARLLVYASSGKNSDILKLEDTAVTDNPNAIISQSWGGCDAGWSAAALDALAAIFEKGAGQGTSIFTSSGDVGAYECLTQNTDWGSPPSEDRIGVPMPASVPWGTGVGGTRISLRADGTWFNETVWEGPASNEGGGGGFSSYYARPSWQVGPGVPPGGADAKRAVPDISADAESGMSIYSDGQWYAGGGTSQSAPIWAGITALLNEYLKHQGVKPVGFMNPALYALADSPQAFPPFHDIVVGTNLVYPATPGYDLASGLGSPDVWNLARDLEAYQRAGGTP